jgi:hypothetical protein
MKYSWTFFSFSYHKRKLYKLSDFLRKVSYLVKKKKKKIKKFSINIPEGKSLKFSFKWDLVVLRKLSAKNHDIHSSWLNEHSSFDRMFECFLLYFCCGTRMLKGFFESDVFELLSALWSYPEPGNLDKEIAKKKWFSFRTCSIVHDWQVPVINFTLKKQQKKI